MQSLWEVIKYNTHAPFLITNVTSQVKLFWPSHPLQLNAWLFKCAPHCSETNVQLIKTNNALKGTRRSPGFSCVIQHLDIQMFLIFH